MSAPETAGANTPSLARDWLYALRYWLRGRNGVIALLLAVVIGGALNWSWLVAVGIAPLLITALPCAVMCGLGLCMNKIAGTSCSTSSEPPDHARTPTPNAVQRIGAGSRPGKQDPSSVAPEPDALPDNPTAGAVEPAPDRQPQVLKRRE